MYCCTSNIYVSSVFWDLHYADPAQPLKMAGEEQDNLDDLSVDDLSDVSEG